MLALQYWAQSGGARNCTILQPVSYLKTCLKTDLISFDESDQSQKAAGKDPIARESMISINEITSTDQCQSLYKEKCINSYASLDDSDNEFQSLKLRPWRKRRCLRLRSDDEDSNDKQVILPKNIIRNPAKLDLSTNLSKASTSRTRRLSSQTSDDNTQSASMSTLVTASNEWIYNSQVESLQSEVAIKDLILPMHKLIYTFPFQGRVRDIFEPNNGPDHRIIQYDCITDRLQTMINIRHIVPISTSISSHTDITLNTNQGTTMCESLKVLARLFEDASNLDSYYNWKQCSMCLKPGDLDEYSMVINGREDCLGETLEEANLQETHMINAACSGLNKCMNKVKAGDEDVDKLCLASNSNTLGTFRYSMFILLK